METLAHTFFLQTISETSLQILNLVENGIISLSTDIDLFLKQEDIIVKIKILSSFLKLFDNKMNDNNYISIMLKSINQNISIIHNQLVQIETKIKKHKTKYFSYIRPLYLTTEKNIIANENKIMMKRFELLVKILQINDKSYKN